MMTLYDYLPSQNAWKVRLLLNHLGRQYRTRLISIFQGEGRHSDYLRISPTGAVPAIELEDGRTLAESNAILAYLAERSAYLPAESFARAKVAQWLFFEGDYVQEGIATLRHWVLTGKDARRSPELLASKRDLSLKTLAILDRELAERAFLAGGDYTIADMSVFAYTHLAGDADLPLGGFRHVIEWIERVRCQPGFSAKTYPYSIDPYSTREL